MSSIADFALDVAVVGGQSIPDWYCRDLAAMPVRAVLDGVTVATGKRGNGPRPPPECSALAG